MGKSQRGSLCILHSPVLRPLRFIIFKLRRDQSDIFPSQNELDFFSDHSLTHFLPILSRTLILSDFSGPFSHGRTTSAVGDASGAALARPRVRRSADGVPPGSGLAADYFYTRLQLNKHTALLCAFQYFAFAVFSLLMIQIFCFLRLPCVTGTHCPFHAAHSLSLYFYSHTLFPLTLHHTHTYTQSHPSRIFITHFSITHTPNHTLHTHPHAHAHAHTHTPPTHTHTPTPTRYPTHTHTHTHTHHTHPLTHTHRASKRRSPCRPRPDSSSGPSSSCPSSATHNAKRSAICSARCARRRRRMKPGI
jgi:hypothetical protein